MKHRNLLLALFCLLVFIAFGLFYFRTWVVQKPFAIILFIGDGLTPRTLEAARLFAGGADHRLQVERLPHMALLRNCSNDFAVPDGPAAATALATGAKVNNRSIGIDPQGRQLRSLLELAVRGGRNVGLVTNGCLTDPGVAAFYGRTSDGRDREKLAVQLLENSSIDVVLGGGLRDFLPESKGGQRKDGRDLIMEMKERGREVVQSKTQLEEAAAFRTSAIAGLFADETLPGSNTIDAGSRQPSLSEMVRRAIEFLQFNQRGYFLVVDAELISRAAGRNEAEQVLLETLELDRALTTALEYAGKDALVIATGKHAVGGMNLNGYPLRQERGIALLGTNPFGYPAFTWATGPHGPQPPDQQATPPAVSPDNAGAGAAPATPTSADSALNSPASERARLEPAAFYAPTAIQTVGDVIAAGMGPGAEALHGFLDNTQVFEIIRRQL